MNLKPRAILLSLAAAVSAAGLMLMSGCKGNSTSAAILGKVEASPPVVAAMPAAGKPLEADPLVDLPWVQMHFSSFVSPINTDRSTPAVRGALLYGSDTLYVAFVNDAAEGAAGQDSDSVFLDTSPEGDGREMIQVRAEHSGKVTASWIRAASPVLKKADGSPDFLHPLSVIPNVPVAGLQGRVRDGEEHGRRVWTAVVAIPFKSLPTMPLPLKTSPQPGMHWKVNLLRTLVGTGPTGGGVEVLQSNLSPVYVDAQPVSPYRMADLTLSSGPMTADSRTGR